MRCGHTHKTHHLCRMCSPLQQPPMSSASPLGLLGAGRGSEAGTDESNKGEQIERLVFHAQVPLVLMDRHLSTRPSLRPEAFGFLPCLWF